MGILVKVFAVMLLRLVAQLATEVHGAPTRHYRNTYDFLLANKGLDHDPFFKDCCQIRNVATSFLNYRTKETGVYDITSACPNTKYTLSSPATNRPPSVVQARCDMVNNGGGWLVILQRRKNISPLVEFNRSWLEYENGFGDLNGEFWYGLKNIHCLTQRDDVELMIELKREDGTGETWIYKEFRVYGPETTYELYIEPGQRIEGTGSGYDFMTYHNGSIFSTKDTNPSNTCSRDSGSTGWWFNACYHSLLTRPHNQRANIWRGSSEYFPYAEMKIRPKSCLVS